MTLTEQLHATRVDLWGDVGAERYGDVIEALHLFAQVTDCPPGASVVNWFSTQADRLEAAERRQSTHPAAPSAPSADKLREFGQHTNLELSYHYSEEGDNDGWQVHQVNGGVNDREWTLMGSGDTPADAIDQALAALSTPDALKGDAKP